MGSVGQSQTLICYDENVIVTALCPVIPIWNGYKIVVDDDDSGVVQWQPRLDGTKLRYSCEGAYDQGVAAAFGRADSTVRYRFADLDTGTKTAYCYSGQWIPPLIPCIGISVFLHCEGAID